jgi:hypothetical protein
MYYCGRDTVMGLQCDPRHNPPCSVLRTSRGAQHTGAQGQFQDQVHWDASSFISEIVASHCPISTDITTHRVSGGLSCLKRQYVIFFSKSQTWLTFAILV